MVPQLTSGVIWACMNGTQVPSDPYIQILSFKRVAGQGNLEDRFRLHISDGEFSHSFAMLAPQLSGLILEGEIESFAVVKVNKMMNNTMNNKKITILLELEVVAKGSEVGKKIGNPTGWVDGMSRPQVAKLAGSRSSSGVCQRGFDLKKVQDTKPSCNGTTPTTPKGNLNRSSNASPFNSYDSPSATKKRKMEKNYVPTAAIAPIQGNSPSNNPITVQACVTKKGEVKIEVNGKGKSFSVDLSDDSGEIRMTVFNDSVDKFDVSLEMNKTSEK